MKILANIIKWLLLAFVLLFVVYFWNLDKSSWRGFTEGYTKYLIARRST